MRMEEQVLLDFDDVLIKPKMSKLSSRSEADIRRSLKIKRLGIELEGFPFVAANMDTIGTMAMARTLSKMGAYTALSKHYGAQETSKFLSSLTEQERLRVFVTTGIGSSDMKKLAEIKARENEAGREVALICADVANGYQEAFMRGVAKIREDFPKAVLMAGNVVTGEVTERLVLAGADIVKVGIGPGSMCETRRVAGVGYPQLSAVIECADYAHGIDGLVCSDGGCRYPGDVAKAFAAGSDFVMAGGMLAGHDECEGEKKEEDGAIWFKTYGMSSEAAMKKHSGGKAQYRSAEGKEVWVKAKGPASDTIMHVMGGVRSACSYLGAKSLKELSKRATFVRVNRLHDNPWTTGKLG